MAQTARDRSAPGDLFLRFVNTRAIHAPDLLADAASTKAWFVETGLLTADAVVTDADAARAREVRAALVSLTKAHVGIDEDGEIEAARYVLDRAARSHPVELRLSPSGSELVAGRADVAGGLASVLAAAGMLAADPREWARYKACTNPPCLLVFRDNSRNDSARYCDHRCSSQVSMRTHRRRRSEATA